MTKQKEDIFVLLNIKAELYPLARGKIADSLNDMLKSKNIGEVTGGGSLLSTETGEILECDIEILLFSNEYVNELIEIIKTLNVPKKSALRIDGKEIPIDN